MITNSRPMSDISSCMIGKLLNMLFKESNTNLALRNAMAREDKSMEECVKYIQDIASKSEALQGISDESALRLAVEYFTDQKTITAYQASDDILAHLLEMSHTDEALAKALKRADKSEKGMLDYLRFKATIEDGKTLHIEDEQMYIWAREYYVSNCVMPSLSAPKKEVAKAEPVKDKKVAENGTKGAKPKSSKKKAEELIPSLFD